jgi:hypothetical protein
MNNGITSEKGLHLLPSLSAVLDRMVAGTLGRIPDICSGFGIWTEMGNFFFKKNMEHN